MALYKLFWNRYKSLRLSLWWTIGLKAANNFFFKLAPTILFRMSKCSLGPIRLIDMHTEDMGGLGIPEDLLLISLSLQCIAYGVMTMWIFGKKNVKTVYVLTLLYQSWSIDWMDTGKEIKRVPVVLPTPPPHPAAWVEISEYADLHISFYRWEFMSKIILCFTIE